MSSWAGRKAYEAGLNGEKPWGRGLGPELYDEQMEGYKQYLANKSLAEAIADKVDEREERRPRRDDDADYTPRRIRNYSPTYYPPSPASTPASTPAPPPKRTLTFREIFWAVFLIWLDYEIVTSFIGMMARGSRDFRQPWFRVFAFLLYFFIFPGGFFLWPTVKLLKKAKLLKGGR
jgi:hypothetical protein